MVPQAQKGDVAQLSASRKRHPSYEAHQQAKQPQRKLRFGALLPQVVMPYSLAGLGWRPKSSDAALSSAVATITECAQAARSQAWPWQPQKWSVCRGRSSISAQLAFSQAGENP